MLGNLIVLLVFCNATSLLVSLSLYVTLNKRPPEDPHG